MNSTQLMKGETSSLRECMIESEHHSNCADDKERVEQVSFALAQHMNVKENV